MRRSWGRGAWLAVVSAGNGLSGGPVGKTPFTVSGFSQDLYRNGRTQPAETLPHAPTRGREAGPSPGLLPRRRASLEAAPINKMPAGSEGLHSIYRQGNCQIPVDPYCLKSKIRFTEVQLTHWEKTSVVCCGHVGHLAENPSAGPLLCSEGFPEDSAPSPCKPARAHLPFCFLLLPPPTEGYSICSPQHILHCFSLPL